jgi:hypothetical protein
MTKAITSDQAARRKTCPQCKRLRFIPHSIAPYCTRSCERAALADRLPSGLTRLLVWVYLGSCPVWRGYDPDTQPEHAAGEEKFSAEHHAHWDTYPTGDDRCSCGGLGCGCGAHYPPEFLTETSHGTEPAPEPAPVLAEPATVAWCTERAHPWVTYNPVLDRSYCRCGQRQAEGGQPMDWDAKREIFHDHPRGTPCRCYLPAS